MSDYTSATGSSGVINPTQPCTTEFKTGPEGTYYSQVPNLDNAKTPELADHAHPNSPMCFFTSPLGDPHTRNNDDK